MNLKNTFRIVFGMFVFMLSGSMTYAQLIGVDAYAIGDHVEIGINGAGGHEGAASLAGSNNRSNLAISSPVYFGFVANPQLDGWTDYDGDFFTPGAPENGFGLEIDGVNYGNNALSSLNEIPGALVSYEEIDDCINVEWEGTVDSVTINVKYHLLAGNLYYTTEVTITNESGTDLTDLYYYRNVDPDNNVTLSGSYVTTNTIVSQPGDSCQKALVSAEQSTPWDSYVGFGALGDDFRVAHGGFSNRVASDMWNGTGGLTGTVGAVSVSDQAISISYKTDLLDGESVNFTYAVVLSESALEEAFQGLYYINFEAFGVSGGGVASECNVSVDTAQTCGGNPVELEILGPNVEDFTWSWSPADGLSDVTGTTTSATPLETTTYTVTGTPIGGCLVEPIIKTIVVQYLDGPQIDITYPGVVCGAFDLTTLVYEDVNGVDGAVTYFLSEEPESATDDDPMWPSDFITEGDSVYLVIADTVNGCFDYELVDIDFAAPANAGSDATVSYCYGSSDSLFLETLLSDDADAGGEFSPSSVVIISDLAPGTYEYLYIVGEEPCPIDSAVITIVVYAPIDVEIDATDASCGADDGSATANASGGMEPYSYLWSTGETTMTIDGLAPGAYTVTVTDSLGCEGSATIEIDGSESDIEIDKLFVDHVTCNGGNDGAIYILPEGGVAPYSYEWSTGETSAEISGLEAGVYTVVITDATGCSISVDVEVTEPDPIDTSITIDGYYLISNEDSASYQWVICPDYEWLYGETDQAYCTPPYCGDTEYAVIITTADGCVDTSACVSLEELSIGGNDGMIELSIYPNPTEGNIFVNISGDTNDYRLIVLDTKGSIILERPMTTTTEMIDLSNVSDGIYFVQIKSENSVVTKRITVSR